MSNEPQKREAGWRAGPADPDPLPAALAGFARAQSEPEVLDLLQAIAANRFGATAAVLLTLEKALVPTRRVGGLTGGAVSCALAIGERCVERLLGAGAVYTTESPASDLPGVAVPEGAGLAALVPCSGRNSTSAVCIFWPAGGRLPRGTELDRLRLLAATAGLAFDRQVADLRSRILRADMDNRIRNVLAVIRSVGNRSAERAVSMEDFLLHFEGRIDAIGRSQIAAGRGGEISFEHLMREELLAQMIQDSGNVSLDGLDVPVTSDQAEALGLAIHELAVNAVKFGAFAGPNGSLAVRWWVESRADALALNIDWRERAGAEARLDPPGRTGFGLTYIEHALPFQINAEVTLNVAPEGLRCQIAVPLQKGTARRAHKPRAMTTAGMSRPNARRRQAAETRG